VLSAGAERRLRRQRSWVGRFPPEWRL